MTSDKSTESALLAVEGLSKHYGLHARSPLTSSKRLVRAVDGVSLSIRRSESVSIVGESGSGKTTLARLILGLESPSSGSIQYEGRDITHRRKWHGPAPIQAVFQDPWGSLNPRMRVERIVSEPMLVSRSMSRRAIRGRATQLLGIVGINEDSRRSYPHEFSGGQRQRIAVARALATSPALIVLDEPVSALDVSIRAQIINLLADLQEEFGTSYLMIAHDFASVRALSDRVLVMYRGAIVEAAPTEEMFSSSRHPYTQALLSASLPLRPGATEQSIKLARGRPTTGADGVGCPFRSRCPAVHDRCVVEDPPTVPVGAAGHTVTCHLYRDA
jgi:oligopeptide/dipeptide ABC transporter ATP-binding protein